ncbi:ATP-binding protein [Fodinibius sp. SL11]|uniref:ATP-binding protein n=1 Tax=Fodinibius sp. SL11 TaxID=3425690 RepID=UPI003F884FB9
MASIDQHKFEPGAMSIIQMGEELIGHPSTAINELIKNGYDADAQNCKVYFHKGETEESSFTLIFDDGTGMDDSTLFGEWLQPSVSPKRKKDATSKIYERNLLGSKGIGRLASMALGKFVTVVSRTESCQNYNWITVGRELFKEDKLLSDIEFPGGNVEDFKELFFNKEYVEERGFKENQELLSILENNDLDNFKRGTLIIIEDFDDAVVKILKNDFLSDSAVFEEASLRKTDFYKSLATLITPINLNAEIQNELLEKNIVDDKKVITTSKEDTFTVDFGINLLPEQEKFDIEWQEIEPIPILSVFDYRVYGKVTSCGDVKGFLSFNRLEDDEFEDSFAIPFNEVIDKSKIGKNEPGLFDDDQENEVKTGEYYFDIRVYDIGEPENRRKLAEKSGFDNINTFRSTFKDFQGLRVSKNGFGVKPYGEENQDWIGLSKARVQDPGKNVSTNQILGYVFFYSPENDELKEKTNREGFQENTAFIQVKNTLKVIFRNLGRKRYNYRLKHGLGRVPSSKHERPDVERFIESIEKSKSVKQAKKRSEKFMKEITTSLDNLEDALTFSERLASLGSGIELVYHEMAQPISNLRTTKSSLDLKKEKIKNEIKEAFLDDIKILNSSTDALTGLRDSLKPAIGRSRRKKFKPYSIFRKVCSLFTKDFNNNSISIKADSQSDSYEIKDFQYPFWIAFLNIINNAVYWIQKTEKPAEIRFQIENGKVIVSNTGPFINEDILDDIFEYGVTARTEKNATGLGLSFTRSILSKNDWQIEAENWEEGPAFIIQKIKEEK